MNKTIIFYQRVEARQQNDILIVFAGAAPVQPVQHELGTGWPALSLLRPAWTTTPCQWFNTFDIPHFREVGPEQVAYYYPEAMMWLEHLMLLMKPYASVDGDSPFVRVSLGFEYTVPNSPDQIQRAADLLYNDFNDAFREWKLADRLTVTPAPVATGDDVSSHFEEYCAMQNEESEGE